MQCVVPTRWRDGHIQDRDEYTQEGVTHTNESAGHTWKIVKHTNHTRIYVGHTQEVVVQGRVGHSRIVFPYIVGVCQTHSDECWTHLGAGLR